MPKKKGGITVKAKQTTLAERVRHHMHKKHGIAFPIRPVDEDGDEYIPMLPPDITTLSNVQLGRLMGEFSVYANYVEGVLALAAVDALESADREETESARQRLLRRDDEGTVKDRADDALLDPTARKAKKAKVEKKARDVFLKSRLNQLERALKVLSREQSRREADLARRDS